MRIDRHVSKSGAYKERLIKKNVRIIKTSTESRFSAPPVTGEERISPYSA